MTELDPSAAPAEPTTPEPAAPATEEQPAAFDPDSLSPEAKAYLKSQVEGEKFKARDTARKTAAEEARAARDREIAVALGLATDEPIDPAKLTEQVEQSQNAAWTALAETQVWRVAGKLGADAEALLDSRSFIDSLEEIDGDDPRAPEFLEALKTKVAEALERNPGLKVGGTSAAPRPDPSQGARGAGPTLDSRIAEAQSRGDWLRVISLQNQKLTTK